MQAKKAEKQVVILQTQLVLTSHQFCSIKIYSTIFPKKLTSQDLGSYTTSHHVI